eukprot:gene6084-6700_t
MITYGRFLHNGQTFTVALTEGVAVEEFTTLLKTIFGITHDIVGILAEKGLVIPMSLLVKNPQVVPNCVCKLLLAGVKAPAVTSEGISTQTSQEQQQQEQDNDEDEEASIEYVSNEIRNFLMSLRTKNLLDTTQYQLLTQLLKQNATLLFAAYSVALSANDSEYFAEICKDLGMSLMSEQGRLACEAQDEVLQICDQLYVNEEITENQLLYLRHLVLIRDESVASLYDDFQEHNSVSLLAASLRHLANTHPFTSVGSGKQLSSSGKKASTPTATSTTTGTATNPTVPPAGGVQKSEKAHSLLEGLSGVVALMLRARLLTNTESTVLLEMIYQENEFIVAAYDLYKKDDNLEDLQDTLLRCVKLEMRKRIADVQEAELHNQEMDYEQDFESETEEDGEVEEEEEESDNDDVPVQKERSVKESSKPSTVPAPAASSPSFSLDDISLESILRSLGVANIWQSLVPEAFIKVVFIAVVHKQLSIDQAKALCDLFHAKYDLVQAAWEVYAVQKDREDFIDSLRRIVRDLNLEEIQKDKDVTRKSTTSTSGAGTRPTSAPAATSATANNTATTTQKNVQDVAAARKAEALQAVQMAKLQLLDHSLEMLTRQGLVSSDKSQALLERYKEGDVMVDAAIETYASDRDVVEFLDTLQILANNSKEDLEDLVRAAQDDDDEDEEEKEEKVPSKPSVSSSTSSDGPGVSSGASLSIADMAFIQISDIVQEMAKSEMIGPNVAQAFRFLIQKRDPRLVKAYEAYLQTKNGADLVDTLLRIVIASVEGMTSAASSTGGATAGSATSSAGKATSSPSSNEGRTAFPSSDQKAVVSILLRAKAVSPAQAVYLNALADAGDPRIQRVFLDYESHKDIYRLMDALKDLSPSATAPSSSAAKGAAGGASPAVSMTSNPPNMSTTSQVDLETAALRLAIAKDEPAVRKAIDAYQAYESLLKQQEQLQSSLGSAKSSSVNNSTSSPNPATSPQRTSPYKSPSSTSPYKTSPYQNYDYDQAEDAEDSEDVEQDDEGEPDYVDVGEEQDEGEEEDGDSNSEGLTSKAARRHVFPILVDELVKESLLGQQAANVVMRLFQQESADLTAALDVYDRDHNMAGLVDALHIIVQNNSAKSSPSSSK